MFLVTYKKCMAMLFTTKTGNIKLVLCLLVSIFLSGCATDDLHYVCINEEPTFDIEEVSTLEDSMSLPNGHDAIILDYNDSYLPEGGTWRVSSVDILLMIPASQFNFYPNNVELTVEVFGGADPRRAPTWKVKQTVDVSKLRWTDVRLTNPDQAYELSQKQAWWTFDFTSVIPESGMRSTTFLVGAAWENDSLPTIGYSNFNRPCDRNWTKYNEVAWKLNSVLSPYPICNWPMMRVNVEERHKSKNCSD